MAEQPVAPAVCGGRSRSRRAMLMTGGPSCRTLPAMATPRHLLVLALVLLLPACATTGTTQTAPAAASSAADASAGATQAEASPHRHAAPPQPPVLPSPVVVPLDAATLSALPREAITTTVHGETLRCEGVALAALLQAAGAMPAGPLRGAQLGRYVQVD